MIEPVYEEYQIPESARGMKHCYGYEEFAILLSQRKIRPGDIITLFTPTPGGNLIKSQYSVGTRGKLRIGELEIVAGIKLDQRNWFYVPRKRKVAKIRDFVNEIIF